MYLIKIFFAAIFLAWLLCAQTNFPDWTFWTAFLFSCLSKKTKVRFLSHFFFNDWVLRTDLLFDSPNSNFSIVRSYLAFTESTTLMRRRRGRAERHRKSRSHFYDITGLYLDSDFTPLPDGVSFKWSGVLVSCLRRVVWVARLSAFVPGLVCSLLACSFVFWCQGTTPHCEGTYVMGWMPPQPDLGLV